MAALLSCGWAVFQWFNLSPQAMWKAYQKEERLAGRSLDPQAYISSQLDADEDAARHPAFVQLLALPASAFPTGLDSFDSDPEAGLAMLKGLDPLLTEFRLALSRPALKLSPAEMLRMKEIAEALMFRARFQLALENGDLDFALEDCLVQLRLAELLLADEAPDSQLTGVAIVGILQFAVGRGVGSDALNWRDSDLVVLIEKFQRISQLATWMENLPRWRALEMHQLFTSSPPRSRRDIQDMIRLSTYLCQWLDAWDPTELKIDRERIPEMPALAKEEYRELAERARNTIGDIIEIEGRHESLLAFLAIDRWILKSGSVPAALSALVPDHLSNLPKSFDGTVYGYRILSKDSVELTYRTLDGSDTTVRNRSN
ncbi:MAG: hypothetical protein R3F19_10045 [Verrucomicrobiales bacterium]